MANEPTFSEYLVRAVGPNWVIAARTTDRLVAEYGDDVKVVTPAKYNALVREYRARSTAIRMTRCALNYIGHSAISMTQLAIGCPFIPRVYRPRSTPKGQRHDLRTRVPPLARRRMRLRRGGPVGAGVHRVTLLFRSPNITVDGAQWYVAVEQATGGKPLVRYRFRLGASGLWKSVHQWPGQLPVALHEFFKPYRRAINVALVGAGAERKIESRASAYAQHRRGKQMQERAAA